MLLSLHVHTHLLVVVRVLGLSGVQAPATGNRRSRGQSRRTDVERAADRICEARSGSTQHPTRRGLQLVQGSSSCSEAVIGLQSLPLG